MSGLIENSESMADSSCDSFIFCPHISCSMNDTMATNSVVYGLSLIYSVMEAPGFIANSKHSKSMQKEMEGVMERQ